MEAWKDELYHWGVKGMKWKKRKKTDAEKAEAAARSMEGAVRAAQEEAYSKNSIEAKKHYNAHFKLNDAAHEYELKGHKLQAILARKDAKRNKKIGDRLSASKRYADDRAYKATTNYKNQAAIARYTKKQNSVSSKAKRLVKDIFSGRAISSETTLKAPDGGVAATRTESKASGGKTVTIDNGKTRSTRYVPNPPKRKKKKR